MSGYIHTFVFKCLLGTETEDAELYNHFVKDGWVMYYGMRKESSIGVLVYFAKELVLIFDVYKSYSIKYTERNSRAQLGSGGITIKIKKDDKSCQ